MYIYMSIYTYAYFISAYIRTYAHIGSKPYMHVVERVFGSTELVIKTAETCFPSILPVFLPPEAAVPDCFGTDRYLNNVLVM